MGHVYLDVNNNKILYVPHDCLPSLSKFPTWGTLLCLVMVHNAIRESVILSLVHRGNGDNKTTHLIKLVFNYDNAVYIPVSLNNLSKSSREKTTYYPIRYSSGLQSRCSQIFFTPAPGSSRNNKKYCWFTREFTVAMLVVKN